MNKIVVLCLLLPLSLNAMFGSFTKTLKLLTTRQRVTTQTDRTLFSRRTLEENVQLADLIIQDINQQKISLSAIHPHPKQALEICLNVLAHHINSEFPLTTIPNWQPSPTCIEIAKALLIARHQRVALQAHNLLQKEPQRSCACARSEALTVLSGMRTFEEDEATKALARSYGRVLITEEALPECPFCE